MGSRTRLPALTLQFGTGRCIDLAQFARSPIYEFIRLTGHGIREAEAAPIDRMPMMPSGVAGRR